MKFSYTGRFTHGPFVPQVERAARLDRPSDADDRTSSPAGGFAPLAVTYSYTVLNDGPATPISDVAVEDGGCAPGRH